MTKYFAATASDGQTVVRSSASRTYRAAHLSKRQGENHWRSSWSATFLLATKAGRYCAPGDRTEIALASEITRAEYLKLKAAWEGTI